MPPGLQYLYAPPHPQGRTGSAAELLRVHRRLVSDSAIDIYMKPDPDTIRFLEPYILELNRQFDLTRLIAYAPKMIPRFGREKANSELGNIAAESMADRRGVQADFALTNTLGIRTDIIRGPITQDQMFNVFPFDNFVTKMYLSGSEICGLKCFVCLLRKSRILINIFSEWCDFLGSQCAHAFA